jgi:hypothetical protein
MRLSLVAVCLLFALCWQLLRVDTVVNVSYQLGRLSGHPPARSIEFETSNKPASLQLHNRHMLTACTQFKLFVDVFWSSHNIASYKGLLLAC